MESVMSSDLWIRRCLWSMMGSTMIWNGAWCADYCVFLRLRLEKLQSFFSCRLCLEIDLKTLRLNTWFLSFGFSELELQLTDCSITSLFPLYQRNPKLAWITKNIHQKSPPKTQDEKTANAPFNKASII